MKDIITSFAFVSMLGFYGNSMAFIISGDTEYSSIPRDLIIQVIADGNVATNKADKTLGKKVGKTQNKIDKLSLKDLTVKQTKKLTTLEDRIVTLLNGMEVPDLSAQITEDIPDPQTLITEATPDPQTLITEDIVSGGELPINKTLDENQPGENVPEPSALALIGLGLAGLGVARRFKKTA